MIAGCGMMITGSAGCRPSDVLSVPPPAGVTPSSAYQNQTGAEGLFTVGKAEVFQGLVGDVFNGGVLPWSGLLGDELTWAYFSFGASEANIDARVTVGGKGFSESGDQPMQNLLHGRLTLMSAIPELERYEPPSGRSKIGEAFALVGYSELMAGEDYCAGTPLDGLAAVQGVQYGGPLTTDSLLGAATVDFDSAASYAGSDAVVAALAAVGLGRARLDRGQFAAAAAAVSGVPTSFVYSTGLGMSATGGLSTLNLYAYQTVTYGCGLVNVGDRKGGNGLEYVSARDPRLVLSTTVAETCDGAYAGSVDSVWYYPVKFGNPSIYVPLATGVEARLIEAEALLQANQVSTWAADLTALRADTTDTHVMFDTSQVPIKTDSTIGASAAAQVDFMFRERAFWLFGTGTRLGDMRRLIRQYGRNQSTVFPTGPYPNGNNPILPSPIPNYGTDVNLTLPTPAGGFSTPNPNYKGCITSTKVA